MSEYDPQPILDFIRHRTEQLELNAPDDPESLSLRETYKRDIIRDTALVATIYGRAWNGALDVLLGLFRDDGYDESGSREYWAMRLGSIAPFLWQCERSYAIRWWTSQLYELAFSGCWDGRHRNHGPLVAAFGQYADWNDDPNDYGLIPLPGVDLSIDLRQWHIDRIMQYPFVDEAAYLRWLLRHPNKLLTVKPTDPKLTEIVDICFVKETLNRIRQLGDDIQSDKAYVIGVLRDLATELNRRHVTLTIFKNLAKPEVDLIDALASALTTTTQSIEEIQSM